MLRAECRKIRIGRMTNVQNFVMVHVSYEGPAIVGPFCSIAHHATLHGCTIEDDCLVGVGATITDGARIGAGSIVADGTAKVLRTRAWDGPDYEAWLVRKRGEIARDVDR